MFLVVKMEVDFFVTRVDDHNGGCMHKFSLLSQVLGPRSLCIFMINIVKLAPASNIADSQQAEQVPKEVPEDTPK